MFIKKFEEFDTDFNLYLTVEELKNSLKDVGGVAELLEDDEMWD